MAHALVSRLAAGVAILASTVFVWAEKPNVIPLATSSKWLLVGSQKLNVDEVRKWEEDPALEKECGVKSVLLRTYTLYPENESVHVLVEEAADSTSAYALFTLYRDDSMTPLADLPSAEVSGNQAIMRRGNRFIRVFAPDAANDSAVQAGSEKKGPGRQFPLTLSQLQNLLMVVGGPARPGDDAGGLPGPLPQKGLVERSEKYLLGEQSAKVAMPSFRFNLLGFSQGAEARLAAYRSGAGQVRVLAVTYPNPQIARQRFGTMENILQINKQQGAQSVFGKVTGSYVILVFDANSQADAAEVLGRFNSTGYVTWNQRYEGDQPIVIQMVRFVLANLFFSFILIGFALFGGLLFYTSKVVARRWFPNSAWGQPDGNTIIRLNL